MESYKEKIRRWSAEEGGNSYIGIGAFIRYLSSNLFFDYEPTLGSYPEFETRLSTWLDNIQSENDQKIMVKLISNLFYVGREELNSLYKTAFESNIVRWFFDRKFPSINNVENDEGLFEMINTTWFCPITDSFRINQFYHINNISSVHEFRPDWRSMKKFGSDEKIKNYIQRNNVKQIVLLEDFVGTGVQVSSAIKYCVETFNVEVLFVPLIICHPGCEKVREIGNTNFKFSPVIQISRDCLVNNLGFTAENLKDYIALSESLYDTIMGKNDRSKIKTFGFRDTGSLTVMYSNTPNNSLPLLHVESNSWEALFRRHSRA